MTLLDTIREWSGPKNIMRLGRRFEVID